MRGDRATRYQGPFASWEEAEKECDGYDSPAILEATRSAVTRYLQGEGVFERDSFLVEEPEYPYFLLASVLNVLTRHNGTAHIVDFGGALGSSYYQLCSFLGRTPDCVWHVVEQEAHVTCGKAEFESDNLKFHFRVEDCLAELDEPPALLVLSGVLHVLPDPYLTLSALLQHDFPMVLIDRAPLAKDRDDAVYVYRVPPQIYVASFPFWLLNRDRLLGTMEPQYQLAARFQDANPLRMGGEDHGRWGFLFFRGD